MTIPGKIDKEPGIAGGILLQDAGVVKGPDPDKPTYSSKVAKA